MMNISMEQSFGVSEEVIALPPDEVHVWHVPLEPSALEDKSGLVDVLAGDERRRADRYKRIQDRAAFVSCRAALRLILGRYTGEAPREISITNSQWGKPQVEGGHASIRFSVSHSHEAGVIALAFGREIGVDVERIRPVTDAEGIAERFFSPEESVELKKLSRDMRLEAFYNCWTRKEAFVKALGKGLSLPLDQFTVTLSPGEPAKLVNVLWDPKESLRWYMHDLPVMPQRSSEKYAGAIVVEGSIGNLRFGQFEI